MLKSNENITINGDSALAILTEVEYMLISLRDIAKYYHPDGNNIPEERSIEYAVETTRFIDENNIILRLAGIRSLISKKFDHGLGEDDMSDTEREMEKIEFWTKPGD